MSTKQHEALKLARKALENVQITGPDDDGLLWINLPGNGTTGKAILRVGKEGLIASQCAKLFEADRSSALTAIREALAEHTEQHLEMVEQPSQQDSEDLYWRLHSLSKSLEGSGRIDEHTCPDAYTTVLDTMQAVQATEHCLWARNGNQPCPHVQAGQQEQKPFGYLWPTGMHHVFRYTQQKRDGVDGMPVYTSPQPESEAVRAAWMAGYTECERDAIEKAQQQEPTDSMGIPLSCGKPLCSPGDHHPMCKLAEQPAQQERLTDSQIMAAIGRHWGGEKTSISQSRPVGQQWDQICELVRCVIRERYTPPPASKPWVGLTPKDIEHVRKNVLETTGAVDAEIFAYALDAKLREKNAAPCKPLTEDEAVSAVSSVLPVTSTGGQRHYFQIQRKYALEITRAIEAAHGIKE